MGNIHVELETLQSGMKEVTEAIGKIHKVDMEYKQQGISSLPSYSALQEQLKELGELSDSMREILVLVTQSITSAYTTLLNADTQTAEDMNQ